MHRKRRPYHRALTTRGLAQNESFLYLGLVTTLFGEGGSGVARGSIEPRTP